MSSASLILGIRADGSCKIGMGHIMRCLALAHALRSKGAEVFFICRNYDVSVQKKIRSERFSCYTIQCPSGQQQDWNASLKVLRSRRANALLVDHYELGQWYHRAVKRNGYKLFVIVDQPLLKKYWADVVLNQNVESDPRDYRVLPGTKIICGPRYALLRKEFLLCRLTRRCYSGNNRFKVLVTLGGADPRNQTLKVLKAIVRIPQVSYGTVVLGMAFKHRTSVIEFCRDHPRIKSVEVPISMARLMAQADFAVSGAGSTCYELAYMGLPYLTLVLAQNQKHIASGLARLGVSANLGNYSHVSITRIRSVVEQLLRQRKKMTAMSRRGRKLVDGKGCERVANVLISACTRTGC